MPPWIAPVTIAVLALGFTTFSFWWIHVRRGSLTGYAPSTFTVRVGSNSISLRLPVVLYNSGAKARVIRELRIVLGDADDPLHLRWNDFRTTLRPTGRDVKDDLLDYVSPYVVGGRQAEQRNITFVADAAGDWPIEPSDYTTQLQGRVDSSERWQDLHEFTLHLWHATSDIGSFSSHFNTPEPCSPDEKARSRQAFLAAAEKQWKLPAPRWSRPL